MGKYLQLLTPDGNAKDILNGNFARRNIVGIISQEIDCQTSTAQITALTDNGGNALVFNAGDVVLRADVQFTEAFETGAATTANITLGNTSAALTTVISGLGTTSANGTIYNYIVSGTTGTSTTLPYVVTADATTLWIQYSSSAAATSGKFEIVLDVKCKDK